MLELILLKLVITVAVVLVLSIIAERVNPGLAGMIAGYPTSTAILLFFFGLELGTDFASQSAHFNLTGLLAALALFFTYFIILQRLKSAHPLIPSVAAFLSYLAVAYALHFIQLDLLGSFLLSFVVIVSLNLVVRSSPGPRILKPVTLNPPLFFTRALLAALILVGITEIAQSIGPEWAGLLSAFPTTVFPLILILHLTYPKEHAQSFIRNLPRGYIALVFYGLAVALAYPVYGVYAGTAIAFLIALATGLLSSRFYNAGR